MATWLLLAIAIAAEVTATLSLKFTEGFTKIGPVILVVAGYLVSFFLLARVLDRGLPLSVVYAIWSAIGIAVLALIDTIWFDEKLSALQIIGLFLVVAGVAALQTGSHPGMTDDQIDGRLAKGERARKALLEATLTIIEREGIAGVTHRNVTREAGLPATSAAYHFATINDLLEQALLSADQAAAEALAQCETDPNPIAAFTRWFVADFANERSRVIAEYELFLYAARHPAMMPTARRWLTDLSALVDTWTESRRATRTICAYIDGILLQMLVSGERPDPEMVEETIRGLL